MKLIPLFETTDYFSIYVFEWKKKSLQIKFLDSLPNIITCLQMLCSQFWDVAPLIL